MRRHLLAMAVVSFSVGLALGTTGSQLLAKDTKPPQIEPRLVIDDEGLIMVEVLTKEKLVKPQLQQPSEPWVTFYEPKEREGKFLYRAKKYYTVAEDAKLSLKSLSEGEDVEFRISLVVPKLAAEAKGPVALKIAKTEQGKKSTEPADVAREASGNDAGLAIINRHRVERGLEPIQFDQDFADVSRINNQMGGGHRYNTGWQTWAGSSDPETAVSMWMGPYWGSHGVIIMNPNITRGGTHSHSTGTTFTGR